MLRATDFGLGLNPHVCCDWHPVHFLFLLLYRVTSLPGHFSTGSLLYLITVAAVVGTAVVASLVALDGPAPNKSSKVKRRPRRRAAALSACAVRMTGALYQKPKMLRFHIQTKYQILYILLSFPVPRFSASSSLQTAMTWMRRALFS